MIESTGRLASLLAQQGSPRSASPGAITDRLSVIAYQRVSSNTEKTQTQVKILTNKHLDAVIEKIHTFG